MSEKTKDIIDTLLCGLYMSVFCVPTIYLCIGLLKYFSRNTILTTVCPMVCGILSGIAVYSVSKKKAGIKWAASAPISIAMLFVIDSVNILTRISEYIPSEYVTSPMGEAFTNAGVMSLVLLAVFVGNITGFGFSGIKFSTKTENVLTAFQKYVCPVLCIIIVVIMTYLFCTLPHITPQPND